MKNIALIAVLTLAACGPREPYMPPVPREVCVGKLEKITGQHLRMTCDTGRVVEYTSYKYDMTEKK